MKKSTHILLPLATFAGLTFLTATAHAATVIPMTNPGFESPDVATNGIQSGSPPTGWTWNGGTSGSGTVNSHVVDGALLPGIADGHTGDQYWLGEATSVDFNYQSQAVIAQDTSLNWADLSAGDTITISVWATYRDDVWHGATDTAIWLNPGEASLLNVWDLTSLTTPGVWTELVWEYEITQASINAANAGSWGAVNVGIGFAATVYSPGQQVAFDDVSMTYVPESGSLAMLCLTGVCFLRRRRG